MTILPKSPGAPIITVSALAKRFDSARGPVTAVDGISFTVPRGATFGLLGGNGAGKSTTLAMLLGLLEPSSGTITILDEDMPRQRHRVLGRMNFSSPYVDVPLRLTVRQNLGIYARLYGVAKPRERVRELAVDLSLEGLLDRRTGSLSAGQRTRVALGKALVNRPELLLLDEPTASLDPDTGDWIRSYLERYRAATGATILLASHNMAEVERLCAHVMMMRGGKIVDSGAPADLIARYGRETLEQVFLDIARAGEREEI